MTVWVVLDLGCHECGVSTEPVGIYTTEAKANAAARRRDRKTQGWRQGGQTFTGVFAMKLPKDLIP